MAQQSQLTESQESQVGCRTQTANYDFYVNLICWVVAQFHEKLSVVNHMEIRPNQFIMSIKGQSVILNMRRVNGSVLRS